MEAPHPMAKRARGSNRPGRRRPIQRTTRPGAGAAPAAARPAAPAPRPTGGLTADEEARAAELEAAIVAQEREAAAIRARGRARAAANDEAIPAPRGQGRPTAGGLAVRYAHEYDYVARDLKRIAALAGTLIAFMIVLWIVMGQTGVFKI